MKKISKYIKSDLSDISDIKRTINYLMGLSNTTRFFINHLTLFKDNAEKLQSTIKKIYPSLEIKSIEDEGSRFIIKFERSNLQTNKSLAKELEIALPHHFKEARFLPKEDSIIYKLNISSSELQSTFDKAYSQLKHKLYI